MSQEQVAGQAGVQAVGLKVLRDLEWLFREQPVLDTGIDALIEVANLVPTGQLIAAQIKTGASYLKERNAFGIVFRGRRKHLQYWLGYGLPVIVILYDIEIDTAYWQHVREEHISRTGTGWKMLVPFHQKIDALSREELGKLSGGSPPMLRLRELRADRPWMELLSRGFRVFLEVDEWVNKSSGRGEIRLLVEDDDGEVVQGHTWHVFLGFQPYSEGLPRLFPWAQLNVDECLYDDAEHDLWEEETGIWDAEEGRYITFGDFGAWREPLPKLRPYGNTAGEVDHWRLEVTLNELGRAFAVVDDYLSAKITTEEGDSEEGGDAT